MGAKRHETGRCSLFAKASDFFKCFRGNGGTKRELQIREKASAFGAAPLFELRIRGYAANFTIIPSSTLLFEFSMKIRPQRIGRFSFRTTVFRLRYLMYVGTKYKEERRIQEKRKKEGSRLCGRCNRNPPNFNSDFRGAKVVISKSCL